MESKDISIASKDFVEDYTFKLNPEESRFLLDQIHESCPNSLLNWILENNVNALKLNNPWDLLDDSNLDPKFEIPLNHAKHFSNLVQGATRLYFCLCANRTSDEDVKTEFSEHFEEWFNQAKRDKAFVSWDLQSFFEYSDSILINKRTPKAKEFLKSWRDLFQNAKAHLELSSSTSQHVFDFFSDRESFLKGDKRSRLKDDDALERWFVSLRETRGPIWGPNYRWGQVRRITADILGYKE
jgi:hypothetical protein